MKDVRVCPICSTEMDNNPNKCPTCGWHDLTFLVKQFQPEGDMPQGITRVNRHREDWGHRAWQKLRRIYIELNDVKATNASLQQEIAALNAENLGIREQIERYRMSEMEISTDSMGDFDYEQDEDPNQVHQELHSLSLADVEILISEKLEQLRYSLLAEIPQKIGLEEIEEKIAGLEGKLLAVSESAPADPELHSWEDYNPYDDEMSGIVIADHDFDNSEISEDFIQSSEEMDSSPSTIDDLVAVDHQEDPYPDHGELELELQIQDFDQAQPATPSIPVPPPANEPNAIYGDRSPNLKATYIPGQTNSAPDSEQSPPGSAAPKRNAVNVVNQLSFQETELVNLYNQGDKSSFEAIEIALTADSQLRRREGYNEPPIFEAQKRGDFWLVNFRHELYLVPKLKLKVNSYNLSTIKSLFNCYGINDKSSSFRLLKPARLKSFSSGLWELSHMGMLQFQ